MEWFSPLSSLSVSNLTKGSQDLGEKSTPGKYSLNPHFSCACLYMSIFTWCVYIFPHVQECRCLRVKAWPALTVIFFFCHCSLQFSPQVIESFVCNSQLTYYFLRLFLRWGPLLNLELTSSAMLAGPWIPELHPFLLSRSVTYMCHPARMIIWVLESELDLHVHSKPFTEQAAHHQSLST